MFIQDPPLAPPPSLEGLLASVSERAARYNGPATVFENVLILNRGNSIRGVAASGVYWVVLPVKGRLSNGETVFFYKTVFEQGEPAPPIGSVCRLEAYKTTWTGGMITGENDLTRPDDGPGWQTPDPEMWSLTRFDCTISSDSPIIVPPSGHEPD